MKRRKRRTEGSLDRRGDTYRVRLCVAGKRHVFTVSTTDRKVAEAAAATKLAELRALGERRAAGLPDTVRVSALLERFEREHLPGMAPGAADAYRDSLVPIRSYFLEVAGDPSIDRIRARDIAAFMTWRRVNRQRGAAALAARTVAKDRAVLHKIFAMAEQLELRDGNPVARVSAPKGDGRDPIILSLEDYGRLLSECEGRPMLELYVLVLGETGVRCESEALRLRWEDVNLDEGFIWIASGRGGHRTKSGKGRWIPMTLRLLAAMRRHFARYRFAEYSQGRPVYVFHHYRARRLCQAGDRIKSLRDAFRAAARRAGLPAELRQHDLRHRRVTTWLAEGKNPVHVKEAMGHADMRTTLGYSHLAREHLRALVEAAPAPRKAEETA